MLQLHSGRCLSILSLSFLLLSDSRAGEGAPRTVDHAVIGGVVAVVVFAMLCLLIVLGRYFARHKGERHQQADTFVYLPVFVLLTGVTEFVYHTVKAAPIIRNRLLHHELNNWEKYMIFFYNTGHVVSS